MTTLLLEILASWTRAILPLLTGYLVQHGILTPDQGDRLVTELLKLVIQYGPAVFALAWGARSTWMKRVKLRTAMAQGPTTEAHVEAQIANGCGAKVI